MIPRLLLAVLTLAAAGTLSLFDAQTGERVGPVREGPGVRVDVFDAESQQLGWRRCHGWGRYELFNTRGERIGETRDGQAILLAPLRPEEVRR